MNFWTLQGRTPLKCSPLDRLKLVLKDKRLGHLLKEDVFQVSNGEIRITTELVAFTMGDEPCFQTMARGPGTPIDVNLKAFESKNYSDALIEHDKLVERIKSDSYNYRR